MILAFLFQTSLCMTVSRSIHIFTNDPISFLKKKKWWLMLLTLLYLQSINLNMLINSILKYWYYEPYWFLK